MIGILLALALSKPPCTTFNPQNQMIVACVQREKRKLPPWDVERERWQRQPLQNDFPTRPDND